MNELLLHKIKKLGLSDNEARVYLSSLSLGRASVAQISHKAGLNRTTSYDVLGRLGTMGVVNPSNLGKRQVFVAESPSRLKIYLKDRERELRDQLKDIDDLIPDLQSLFKIENKPVINFFEGREGIKNIYARTLEAKSEIYSILDLEQWLPEWDDFGKEYIKERYRRKIKEKVLVQKNNKGEEFYNDFYETKKHYQENTEYRWLAPKDNFSPATEINIYDDKVMGVLVKPGENVAFEIESESFANSLKIIFEMAWGVAGSDKK